VVPSGIGLCKKINHQSNNEMGSERGSRAQTESEEQANANLVSTVKDQLQQMEILMATARAEDLRNIERERKRLLK
jgi:hypothetical protein